MNFSYENLVKEWIDFNKPFLTVSYDFISRKYFNISYGSHPLQKLDLFYPEEEKERYPVVILIHGGGFYQCDKQDWHVYPGFFALKEGFALISANYRLAPEHRHPDLLYDIKHTIAWVRRHSEAYKLDLNNIFLLGGSAGGNLAALAAFSGNGSFCPVKEMDYHVNAVGVMCPVINFKTLYEQHRYNPQDEESKEIIETMYRLYMGEYPPTDMECMRQMSADTFLDAGHPPVYLLHGDRDTLTPVEQSHELAIKIRQLSGEEKLVFKVLKNAGHAGSDESFLLEENLLPIIEFFKNYIKKRGEEK